MREHNAAEPRLRVRLARAVKAPLDAARIPLRQFYGAGAAATAYLSQIGAKKAITRLEPSEVIAAGRGGSIGGRIPLDRPDSHAMRGVRHRYFSSVMSGLTDLVGHDNSGGKQGPHKELIELPRSIDRESTHTWQLFDSHAESTNDL